MRFILTLALFLQQSATVRLRLITMTQEPVTGTLTRLDLYTFENGQTEGEMVVRTWYSEQCTTNQKGFCEFSIPDAPTRMLQGTIFVDGYGYKDLLWPGGTFDVVLPVEQIGVGGEPGPYSFQDTRDEEALLIIDKIKGPTPPFYALIFLVVLILAILFLYKQAKKENQL